MPIRPYQADSQISARLAFEAPLVLFSCPPPKNPRQLVWKQPPVIEHSSVGDWSGQ